MDFSAFDSRAAASRGIWLHVEHPSRKGVKLYADDDPAKPCRVKLLGREAPEAAVHYARIAKANAKDGVTAKKPALPETNEEIHAKLVEMALPLVVEFENIGFDGKPATKADAERFLNLQTINGNPEQLSFVEQILRVAGDRDEALGNA